MQKALLQNPNGSNKITKNPFLKKFIYLFIFSNLKQYIFIISQFSCSRSLIHFPFLFFFFLIFIVIQLQLSAYPQPLTVTWLLTQTTYVPNITI